MSDFKVSLRKFGLQALHCGLFSIGAMVIIVLIVSAWLRRILAPLPPMIFAALPEHYRRVLVLLAKALPNRKGELNRKPVS